MKIKKIKRVMNLHLSVYDGGMHITQGFANDDDKRWGRLSVKESLVPFSNVLQEFQNFPLGTKIKVTIENVK